MEELLRFLDDDGVPVGPVPEVAPETLSAFYRWMVLGRAFEERAVILQRQGRLGVFGPIAGQEAAYVGSAMALEPTDWMCPSYRDFLPVVVRGFPLPTVWLYCAGDPRGSWIPDHINALPFQVILATQTAHAVGMAMAAKYKGREQVALAYLGDGATSEGDFHEAMNMAGVQQAPVIFFCTNNHWAISTPLSKQTAARQLVDKAAGYGVTGVRVDGMDVLAVYQATKEAAARARQGGGPTFIEAVAYRLGAHTTVDDPRRYRDEAEVTPWRRREPIARFQRFLVDRGLLTEDTAGEIRAQIAADVMAAFDESLTSPPAQPDWMFDKLLSDPPASVTEQKLQMRAAYAQDLPGKEG